MFLRLARSKPVHIDCVNRFEPLSKQADSSCRDKHIDSLRVDVNPVECKVKALGRNERERRLGVTKWNFSRLYSEYKQKEVAEFLVKSNIGVVAGWEFWEKEDTGINVEGYKWFGKPRSKARIVREGREGFAF